MKKSYIIPTERIVNLEATEMLAESNNVGVSDDNSLGYSQPTTDDPDNQFVKSQSQWDNEW